jgi:hypothetical protein
MRETAAVTAGYSGTPLPRKLGIREASRVLLVAAPAGFDLGLLPPRALIHHRRGRGPYDVIVTFCPDARALARRFTPMVPILKTAGSLWACWPKRSSGIRTDLSENTVRDHGLSTGLVDVKVAAIDEVWSGLMFVRRLGDR